MSRVRSRDTTPERIVRSLVHKMGYRFRLHSARLPGRPDIVLAKHKKIVLVNGCFWHAHEGCGRATRPSSHREFWDAKIAKNIERDRQITRELCEMGWSILTVWECETRAKRRDSLMEKLATFLGGK